MRFRSFGPLSLTACLLVAAANGELACADEQPVDYLRDVKPIFARHCTKCHGPEKRQSGLRLDAAELMRRGGDSGPGVIAGKPNKSLVLMALTGSEEISEMPPDGPKPTAAEIETLRRWIEQGAKAPEEDIAAAAGSDHWSFQRPTRPPLPEVRDRSWPRGAIDRFILARLEAEGIAPSPEADRRTLIRRLSLDLRGIAPTVGEVDEFVGDLRPDAYERLVDRMLASPAYGERWGRHWLDIARYADSNGYTRDFAREIWLYRDWVINAVNRDQPFDQFTIEQIAGDMLPDATMAQRLATGFHRNTQFNEEGGTDDEQFRIDAVADRVNTTATAFLGLTLECARCHEHKFDPLAQREYYQFFAFLNNCDEPKIEAPSPRQIERGDLERRQEIRARIAELTKEIDAERDKFDAAQQAWEAEITPEQRSSFPGPLQVALMVEFEKRDAAQKKLVEEKFKTTEAARTTFPQVEEIYQLQAAEPVIPTSMVLAERDELRATFVHKRGNFLDAGPQVQPRTPAVLNPLEFEGDRADRLDLARWLVDPANPLTPRVTVNRWWQRLFGHGIVETENDFGTQGSPPSHPHLLDWLAVELVESDWSMKRMHRLIVTSAAYRQSSHWRSDLETVDPRNVLLARQSRIRLEAEIVRDAALSASGLLSRKIGGPSVHPPQPEGVFEFTQDPKPWNTDEDGDRYRRAMYTFLWRSSPYPALTVFDAPDGNVSCTRRVRSNTPLQALTLANDATFLECARALAARVLAESPKPAHRGRRAFELCYARRPSPQETARLNQLIAHERRRFAASPEAAREFVGGMPLKASADMGDAEAVELAVWTAACRVLINVDEFITRQ
ncbi:MAG: PSD1 and planctomycete cytochrome C domain-containing protein [Pirellulaceae bacterium]